MTNVIQVEHLYKKFHRDFVLSGLTFQVKEKEIFGFLGPSGSGKTTTLKIITGQLLPTSGEVKVFGEDSKHQSSKSIGILSDNSSVYDRLTIKENLLLFARLHNADTKEVEPLLKRMNLYEEKDQPVKSISKGMKQRLLLACAVIHKPDLLFLDEPTSSLDPTNVLDIQRLIKELNAQGTTIFLTTHNMVEADKLCDRIAFLNKGEIVEMGSPEELKLKYSNTTVSVKLKNEETVLNIDLKTNSKYDLIQWIHDNELLTIHSNEPTIEDIFVQLTGRELI